MQDKKLIFLVVLGVLAVGSLIYGIATPSGARRQLSQESSNLSGTASAPLKGSPAQRRAARSTYDGWVRSPFTASSGGKNLGPVLNGIAWDEKSPRAIINDQIVQAGDFVGKYKVVAIQPQSVLLNDGSQDLDLKLIRK